MTTILITGTGRGIGLALAKAVMHFHGGRLELAGADNGLTVTMAWVLSSSQAYHAIMSVVLLPLWIAAYRYQDKTFRFLVNGQTGEVQGEAPTSWFKVVMVIAIVVAIIAGIVFAVRASKGG